MTTVITTTCFLCHMRGSIDHSVYCNVCDQILDLKQVMDALELWPYDGSPTLTFFDDSETGFYRSNNDIVSIKVV